MNTFRDTMLVMALILAFLLGPTAFVKLLQIADDIHAIREANHD